MGLVNPVWNILLTVVVMLIYGSAIHSVCECEISYNLLSNDISGYHEFVVTSSESALSWFLSLRMSITLYFVSVYKCVMINEYFDLFYEYLWR